MLSINSGLRLTGFMTPPGRSVGPSQLTVTDDAITPAEPFRAPPADASLIGAGFHTDSNDIQVCDTELASAFPAASLNSDRTVFYVSGSPVLSVALDGTKITLTHEPHPFDDISIRVTDLYPRDDHKMASTPKDITPQERGTSRTSHQHDIVYITIGHQIFAFNTHQDGRLGLKQITSAELNTQIISTIQRVLTQRINRVFLFRDLSSQATLLGSHSSLANIGTTGALFQGRGVDAHHLKLEKRGQTLSITSLVGSRDRPLTWITNRRGFYQECPVQQLVENFDLEKGRIRIGQELLVAGLGRLTHTVDNLTVSARIELEDPFTIVVNAGQALPYVQIQEDATGMCQALVMFTPGSGDPVKIWIQSDLGNEWEASPGLVHQFHEGMVIKISATGHPENAERFRVIQNRAFRSDRSALPFCFELVEEDSRAVMLRGAAPDATLPADMTVNDLITGGLGVGSADGTLPLSFAIKPDTSGIPTHSRRPVGTSLLQPPTRTPVSDVRPSSLSPQALTPSTVSPQPTPTMIVNITPVPTTRTWGQQITLIGQAIWNAILSGVQKIWPRRKP